MYRSVRSAARAYFGYPVEYSYGHTETSHTYGHRLGIAAWVHAAVPAAKPTGDFVDRAVRAVVRGTDEPVGTHCPPHQARNR